MIKKEYFSLYSFEFYTLCDSFLYRLNDGSKVHDKYIQNEVYI